MELIRELTKRKFSDFWVLLNLSINKITVNVIEERTMVLLMQIAIIASDTKKELMTEFCIAYQGILCKHDLCATDATGKYISEATGLNIDCVMSGMRGGIEQIASRIAFNEIDLLLFFRNTIAAPEYKEAEHNILRLCDIYNVPFATNIATAEALILALDQGTLDWRDLVNPKSKINRKS